MNDYLPPPTTLLERDGESWRGDFSGEGRTYKEIGAEGRQLLKELGRQLAEAQDTRRQP